MSKRTIENTEPDFVIEDPDGNLWANYKVNDGSDEYIEVLI